MEAYNYQSESNIDPNNVFSIVNVDDKTKALKIKMNPIYSSSIRKTYNISGKKGEYIHGIVIARVTKYDVFYCTHTL